MQLSNLMKCLDGIVLLQQILVVLYMTMTMKMIFLDAWDNMLDKYDLKNNNWLQRQFGLRENWALVYGRKTFCADMFTTKKSESMNSQTKRYITYNYDLLRFFHHFQRLVDDRHF